VSLYKKGGIWETFFAGFLLAQSTTQGTLTFQRQKPVSTGE